jgi:hypothetical protein
MCGIEKIMIKLTLRVEVIMIKENKLMCGIEKIKINTTYIC